MGRYALTLMAVMIFSLGACIFTDPTYAGDGYKYGLSITMPLNMKDVGRRGTFTVYGERFTQQDIVIEAPNITYNSDNSVVNTSVSTTTQTSTTIKNTTHNTTNNSTTTTNQNTSVNVNGINSINGGIHIH